MIDNKKLDEMMGRLNFAESLAGTDLIRAGVAMVEAQRDISMTKELYPALAKATGTDYKRVERNMRHAIQNAAQRGDWGAFIGDRKPTVSEVLARLARRCSVAD